MICSQIGEEIAVYFNGNNCYNMRNNGMNCP